MNGIGNLEIRIYRGKGSVFNSAFRIPNFAFLILE